MRASMLGESPYIFICSIGIPNYKHWCIVFVLNLKKEIHVYIAVK